MTWAAKPRGRASASLITPHPERLGSSLQFLRCHLTILRVIDNRHSKIVMLLETVNREEQSTIENRQSWCRYTSHFL
jgi:hypothetical protein